MENVLTKAAQLLQSGEPEDALLLLNQLSESTAESEQLKTVCKQALSEQYLWLLNDAVKNNRKDEIKAYVNRYHNLIGHDGRIVKYEAMLATEPAAFNLNNSIINQRNDVGELALIPMIMLLLMLLINIFSGNINYLCCGWNWERPWILAHCVSGIFYLVYLATASFVFAKISNNSNKLYMAWTIISSLSVLSDFIFISGFNYYSLGYLLTLRILNAIAALLLVVFLIMEMRKTTVYKVSLFVGAIVESVILVNKLLGTYVVYKPYVYANLESLDKVQNIAYYAGTILMAATFFLFFLTSKKLTQKK